MKTVLFSVFVTVPCSAFVKSDSFSLLQLQANRQLEENKHRHTEAASLGASSNEGWRFGRKTLTTQTPATKTPDGKLHHILFIMADDLRPEISPYGHAEVKSPNMQSLATDGFTFKHAYVQQAVCGPSRTAILTGRRPDTSRVWGNKRNFRATTGRDWSTLPQFFKENGWRSIGIGKIYHETLGQDQNSERGGSWSVPHQNHGDSYCNYNPHSKGGIATSGVVNKPWDTFRDGKHVTQAIKWMMNASKYDEPFFLAVGFHLPHIPYVYPQEFAFTGDLNFPPKNWHITKDLPPVALHDWTDEGALFTDLRTLKPQLLQSPQGKQNLSSLCTAVPVAKQMEMKHAYLSSVQYIDFLIGRLTKVLIDLKIYDQTTIVLLGDHGYKLGEHCEWFKHDNYELSTRFPLIMKPAAHVASKKGLMLEQVVESVDIYPTLIETVGLKVPAELEGQSMLPLLHSPSKEFKEQALSQYPHWIDGKWCMGYTMRTQDWRYTEWIHFYCEVEDPMSNCAAKEATKPNWDEQCGVELYDHRGHSTSFEEEENENLAYKPEFAAQVKELHEQLVRSWVSAGV